MCIITTLNQGLRNGGGIGDVLRKPSSAVSVIVYLYFVYTAQISNINVHVYRFFYEKMECTG